MSKTLGSKKLSWKKITEDSLAFFKKPNLAFGIFFVLFVILALPNLPDLDEWKSFPPLRLWMLSSFWIIWLFFTYLVSVVFIIWISENTKKSKNNKIWPMVQKATVQLVVPLTILSVRGSILSVFGLVALVLPGLYFAFKYELASTCLILEGWQDNHPPVKRAEEAIQAYGIVGLLPLAIIMVVGWAGPWAFEAILRLGSFDNSWISRCVVGLIDAVFTVSTSLYSTTTILAILKGLKGREE